MQKRLSFEINLNLSPKQIHQILRDADHNKDGFVDREEFKKMALEKGKIMRKRQKNFFK